MEIIDRDGWRKTFTTQKRIIHIGSSPQNDIVLASSRGSGVASRHLQLIASPSGQGGYRLVNLGDTSVVLGVSADRTLAPRASTDVVGGEHIKVGDFTLILESGQGYSTAGVAPVAPASVGDAERPAPVAPAKSTSRGIGLELTLPKNALSPDRPIEGSVVVRNLGNQPAAQFKLVVEGLPADCYEIGAGPMLFPNAEKEVYFRLSHPQGSSLLAGNHHFTIRATAPEAYPEESARVSQVIRVLPFYRHAVRLVTLE